MSTVQSENWEDYIQYDASGYVYVLECEPPSLPDEFNDPNITFKQKTSHGHKEIKSIESKHIQPKLWLRIELFNKDEKICPLIVYIANSADKLYYVGKTENIEKRIKSHINGYGGKFTNVMDVVGIERVESITGYKNMDYLMRKREEMIGQAFNQLENTETGFALNNIKSVAHYDGDWFTSMSSSSSGGPILPNYNISIAVPQGRKNRQKALESFK